MNDFLKSLRSNGKDRRYDRPPRRPYGNSSYQNNPQYNNGNSHYNGNPQYRGNDKANGNLKKSHFAKSEEREKLALLLGEALPEIKSLMENIAESQKQLVVFQERRAEAEERKADAIESLADALKDLLGAGFPAPRKNEAKSDSGPDLRVVPSRKSGSEAPAASRPERDAVLDLIYTMRENGATYTQIASHLEDEKIPTFSGKGKWHAQTIHRVCQTPR